VNFSPSGDYFTSGGSDGVVMIWKSNLNDFEMELIDDFGGKTTTMQPTAPRPASRPAASATKISNRPSTAKKGQTSAVKIAQPSPRQSTMKKVPSQGTFCGM
jgi:WD40 repeat protein